MQMDVRLYSPTGKRGARYKATSLTRVLLHCRGVNFPDFPLAVSTPGIVSITM